jgi:hypothetical protein
VTFKFKKGDLVQLNHAKLSSFDNIHYAVAILKELEISHVVANMMPISYVFKFIDYDGVEVELMAIEDKLELDIHAMRKRKLKSYLSGTDTQV